MLIQVSPVERGGVFDYLQCLKARWADAHGTPSHAVPLSEALARERSLDTRIDDCLVRSGRSPHPAEDCSVVLHYSGYGYGDRGLCFWLLRELKDLRKRRGDSLRLVIVFHELFATGAPWQSAFWLSKPQAFIARRLAGLADAIWTNTELHAAWLRDAVSRGTPVHARPVFSNVGEPEAVPDLNARSPVAVVFGSAATRQRAFDALQENPLDLRELGVEELVEAGGGGPSRHGPNSLPCRHMGRLDIEALRSLLHGSRFGLLDYPAHYLAKSGVFAAYAAHGCAVLNTRAPAPDSDGLVAGEHYLPLALVGGADLSLEAHQRRAHRLHRWYQAHRVANQSRELLFLAGAALPSG